MKLNQPAIIVCILGMHRSGTSCLAGCLQAAGLPSGVVQDWNFDNQRGNREQADIIQLNDAVLKASGGSWDKPPQKIQWETEHEVDRDRILSAALSEDEAWSFKEPRTLLTLPFWSEGIQAPIFVGTFRDPIKVAISLFLRPSASIPIRKGIELWCEYNQRLLGLVEKKDFPIISFDLPVNQYRTQLGLMVSHLSQHIEMNADRAASFYEDKLPLKNSFQAIAATKADEALLVRAFTILNQLYDLSGVSAPAMDANNIIEIPLSDNVDECMRFMGVQPNNAYAVYALANALEKGGKTEQASKYYEKAKNLNSEIPHISMRLAESLSNAGLKDKAILAYQSELNRKPDNPELPFKIAKLHESMGELDSAIESYRAAITCFTKFNLGLNSSTFRRSLYGLIDCYIRNSDFEHAIGVCKEFKSLGSSDDNFFRLKGRAEIIAGYVQDASNSLQRAADLKPNKAINQHMLGNVRFRLKEFEAAKHAYFRATELEPDHFLYYKCLGDSHMALNNIEAALENFDYSLKLNEKSHLAYLGKGRAYARLGKKEEAYTCYKSALDIKPDFVPAKKALNQLE